LGSRARACSQAPDSHANGAVYRTQSGLVMALRAKRVATLRAILDGCHMLLNLRGHDLLLQARKQRFAFYYSQSHGGRRDFLRPLDDPQLVFDGTAWDRLKYQFDCPFHLQRLPLPTTLHTLQRLHCIEHLMGGVDDSDYAKMRLPIQSPIHQLALHYVGGCDENGYLS